ncbi:hypothetical protein ONZ51_g13092 [Trametes cubensis]|uniref:Heterokaryon incompatibility domain-containing protein n=1 Tax=Trametes cubensis TaxID=1111947 RepID=A0AAD7TEW3_9APHY|nr:hypothetical protein ONZ51_g13092 [Trametes cubensis]
MHGPGDAAVGLVYWEECMSDVGSPRALAQAKAYFDECAHRHHICKACHPVGSSRLPTRLIDCTDPEHPRIVQTEPDSRGSYIALSYVWGEDQPYRTTEANISSYMKFVDPASLSKTIRDAIKVTHALGVRFLWVDSLCIIQDSPEDKHRELRSMLMVYRSACLTIDAASAERVSEGFLHDRQPLVSPVGALPLIVPSSWTQARGAEIVSYLAADLDPPLVTGARIGIVNVVRSLPPDLDALVRRQHSPANSAQPSKTARRAWCLQETVLSWRTLIYTSETFQFSCQSAIQDANGVARFGDQYRGPHGACGIEFRYLMWNPSPSPEPINTEVFNCWSRLVSEYSRRALSHPTDKLVACAGLAEMVALKTKMKYLAGLWDANLFVDLLWSSPSEATHHLTRPSSYRAPSWSWASVDGEVGWKWHWIDQRWNEQEVQFLVQDWTHALVPQDPRLPFGALIDGSLTLHAPLVLFKHWRSWSRRLYTINSATLEDAGYVGATRARRRRLGTIQVDVDCEEDYEVEELWALPIMRTIERGARDDGSDRFRTYGLLVTLNHGVRLDVVDHDSPERLDCDRSVYRRVGMFKFKEDMCRPEADIPVVKVELV